MNRFLRWILVTNATAACVIILLAVINKIYFLPNLYSEKYFKLPPSVDLLIAGASHSQTAFNPEYIEHSYSIAQSGENCFYTYHKLLKILPLNVNIRTVLMAFSPSHVSSFHDATITNSAKTKIYFKQYFPIINHDVRWKMRSFSVPWVVNYLKMELGVPFDIIGDARRYLTLIGGQFRPELYSFWGGFGASERMVFDEKLSIRRIKIYFYQDGKENEISDIMIAYLEKIAELCENRNIELILVGTPVHKQFFKLIPAKFMKQYLAVAEKISLGHQRCIFQNLLAAPLGDDCYGDGDHVNVRGSREVARMISKNLPSRRDRPRLPGADLDRAPTAGGDGI